MWDARVGIAARNSLHGRWARPCSSRKSHQRIVFPTARANHTCNLACAGSHDACLFSRQSASRLPGWGSQLRRTSWRLTTVGRLATWGNFPNTPWRCTIARANRPESGRPQGVRVEFDGSDSPLRHASLLVYPSRLPPSVPFRPSLVPIWSPSLSMLGP